MREKKRTPGLAILGVILALAVVSPLIAGEDPERTCLKCRVKVIAKTHASGDLDKLLSFLADDYTRVDVATGKTVGREAIEAMLEWEMALHGRFTYDDLVWEGATVTGLFEETNDIYDLLGIEPRRYRMVFTFEEDLLREQRIERLEPEGPGLDEALAPFLVWASGRRADALALVYRDGGFVYGGSEAERCVQLLTDWASEKEVSGLGDS
jgi:hypothetical protein